MGYSFFNRKTPTNGSDYLEGTWGNDLLYAFGGDDNVQGSFGNDTLDGGAGNDTLRGGPGNDALYGGNNDDLLRGGAGRDKLHGGAGYDTVSYKDAPGSIIFDLTGQTAHRGDAVGDTYERVEHFIGSQYNDQLWGDNSANSIDGYQGADRLFGRGGNDTLKGGGGNDIIAGGAGADRLDGQWGSDTLSYNDSNAGVYISLASNQAMYGHAAGDQISGFEHVIGSRHGDSLIGNSGYNMLQGQGGNDHIWGNAGNDKLYGHAGNDHLRGGAGADLLDGGSHTDTANYSGSSAAVTVDLGTGRGSGGHAQGDFLRSIENLVGSSYNDRLTGSRANNDIHGGRGNDTLQGGGGFDELTGGRGADTFLFEDRDFGTVKITDFDLWGSDADTLDIRPTVARAREVSFSIREDGNDTAIMLGEGTIIIENVDHETFEQFANIEVESSQMILAFG